MTIGAVLIDLDGTLVDTLGEIAAAANAMLADAGRPAVAPGSVADAVGEGAATLVERLLGPGSAERWLPVYLAHYRRINATTATLYPHVVEGLAAMRSAGLKVACVTNKPRELVGPLLAHHDIAAAFDATIGGGDTADKKPKPAPLFAACERLGVAPARAVMIGDSINDARAARAAAMPSLTVPYGYPGAGGLDDGADRLLARGLTDAVVSDLVAAARWIADRAGSVSTNAR